MTMARIRRGYRILRAGVERAPSLRVWARKVAAIVPGDPEWRKNSPKVDGILRATTKGDVHA